MDVINPASICAPAGLYSHGVVAPAGGRWLYVSGQIGMRPDGTMADGFEEQARIAWRNLMAVLSEAGMGIEHLVKVNSYLVEPSHLPLLGRVRAEFQPRPPPASTLVFVKALVRPEWLYEVDAVAFHP
ncbi:MAG: hypothetical protein AMXMBFR66_01080 [Pseudomonadota bacterium]|nr:RidA family protein [Rubrivivax sp.]NLZ41419.1 RidA family protein [Comamonadaceae bacterium]